MSGVNKVILVGYAGTDAEIRYTANGKATASFRIGVTERTDGPTEWVSCVVWEKLAEIVAQHVVKGKQLYVEGRLQTRSWDDKEGKKQYRTELVANTVQFLGAKTGNTGSDYPDYPDGELDPEDLPLD